MLLKFTWELVLRASTDCLQGGYDNKKTKSLNGQKPK